MLAGSDRKALPSRDWALVRRDPIELGLVSEESCFANESVAW